MLPRASSGRAAQLARPEQVEALGLRAVPSKANFVLVLFEGALSAETAYHGLMDRGYIVRWLPNQGLGHGLRVTIGTEDEVRGVVAGLKELVAEAQAVPA